MQERRRGNEVEEDTFNLITGCLSDEFLGVANSNIVLDSQFTASSTAGPPFIPHCARLKPPSNYAGWRAGYGDDQSWIQVDLLKSTKISAILSQGMQSNVNSLTCNLHRCSITRLCHKM